MSKIETTIPFISEFHNESRIEVRVQEDITFENPILLLPEEPCPIDPSDLSFVEPLGYMWADGVMTETNDRNSKVVKKHTPWDEWMRTDTPSTFNELIDKGELPEKKQISDTYIL